MRRLLPLAAVLAVLVPAGVAHARTSIVEVPVGGPADVTRLQDLGFDVTHDVTATSAEVVLHDDAERRRLAAAGFRARVVVADLDAASRRWRAQEDTRAADGQRSDLPTGRDTYRYLAEYTDEIADIAAEHAGIARRIVIGQSVQGRDLEGLELGANVNVADGRPNYVVIGLHHAREWPSGEVAMELAHDLVDGFGSDARITALLERVRVVILPVTNPDGFLLSRGTYPLPSGADPMQRKNAAEVDLNRNYGAFWGGNGASNTPSSDIYRGPSPWSEPESQAIHELSQARHITNFQSIHNIAALVLRPPGFEALGPAPDEPRLKELGDRMATAAGYASEFGYELYEVTGATEDWNYVAQNTFGYTIELGGQLGFQGPYLTNVVEQYAGTEGRGGVREALLLAGEQAADTRDHSVIQGAARPGAVLRLRKTFTTATSPVCEGTSYDPTGSEPCPTPGAVQQLADGLDTQLTVPASGRYEWHITPSTRPFVRKAGGTESWTLSCESPAGTVLDTRALTIGLGERQEGDPCTPGSRFVPVTDGAPGGAPPAGTPSGAVPPSGGPAPRALAVALRLVARQRRATVRRRGVLVRATCAVDCTLGVTLRRGTSRGTVLGRGTVRLRAGRARAFRVRLSRAGARALPRLSRVVLRVEARAGADRQVSARRIALRR